MRSEGYAGHATPYDLFAEMEDKDPHLFSALQTRKLGVLARSRAVEPAGDTPRDREIAAWVDRTLAALPGWQAGLLHLLDALGKGMAVVEVLWGFDVQGRIVPRALRPRAAQRFIRGAGGEWRLLRAETGPGGVPFGHGELLPPRKFIIALYGADDERPYGKGLCERVYWLWWFKKHNIRVWLVHNEKFGSPTVVARHRPGLSDAEHERLLQIIERHPSGRRVTNP